MDIPWWYWSVAGLVFLAGELLTPGGLFLLFFGVGALITSALAALGLLDSLGSQVLLFTLLSLGTLLVLRRRLLSLVRQKQMPEVDSLVGEVAVATQAIAPRAEGRVELRGSVWQAHNLDAQTIAAGEGCEVDSVQGLRLQVRKKER